MKKSQITIVINTLVFIFLTSSFKSSTITPYAVNIQKSTIAWEGHKFFGGQHTGTIQLLDGQLIVEDNQLKGGTFTIDMNSIHVTDLTGETAKKLADHLKTDDFFDAVNYPTATFNIKHVEYANDHQAALVGDITIRGITQELVFLAEIHIEGTQLKASANNIQVDRTIHEATYGSVRFFRDLGRKIVKDEFALAIELYAASR